MQINTINKSAAAKIFECYTNNKDPFLKLLQYVTLFISWYYRQENELAKRQEVYKIYKTIFYSRRIYRSFHCIAFLKPMLEAMRDIRKGISLERITILLINSGKFFFYLLDTVAITMKFTKHPQYIKVRRISFAFFLIALLSSIIMYGKKLRQSFTKERQIRPKELGSRNFLMRLKQIDQQRTYFALTVLGNLGDLFPTMQRISITQELLYTRINRGTMAFFGATAALMQIFKAYLFLR